MKAFNKILAACFLAGIMCAAWPAQAEEIICPGSGERCAQVKFLFIKYWKMKQKNGPGIIIIKGDT